MALQTMSAVSLTSGLLAIALTLVSSQSVSMKIAYPNTQNFFYFVNFDTITFNQFYNCVTLRCVNTCTMKIVYDSQRNPLEIIYNVTNVATDSSFAQCSNHNIFTCNIDPTATEVVCKSYMQTFCNLSLCQPFRQQNSTYCGTCVTIFWSTPEEELQYAAKDNIENCSSSCPQTTSPSTITTRTFVTTYSTSNVTSDKPTMAGNSESQPDNSNTPIIVGVVCGGILLVIIIIIVIFLCRRRKLQVVSKKHGGAEGVLEPRQPSQLTFNSTSTHRPGVVMPTIYSSNNNLDNEDLNTTYYTIDHDDITNSCYIQQNRTIKEQTTLESDYSHIDLDTHSIIDSVSGYDSSSPIVDYVSPDVNYSLARDLSSLGDVETSSEHPDMYARLGEDVTHITNPYNMLLKPTEDLKYRKRLPEPTSSTQSTIKKGYDNNIIPSAKLTDSETSSNIYEKSPTNISLRIPLAKTLPGYSVVTKSSGNM